MQVGAILVLVTLLQNYNYSSFERKEFLKEQKVQIQEIYHSDSYLTRSQELVPLIKSGRKNSLASRSS